MARFREIVHSFIWAKRHIFKQLPVPEIRLLAAFIEPTDTLIDIGAHSGSWTMPLAKLVPAGRVYAFEALPYYARVLATLIRILGMTNVAIVGKAVLDKEQSVQIVWRDPTGNRLTGLTHIAGAAESEDETLTVDGITLDTLSPPFEGHIRFVKIDIEGAELQALRGSERLIGAYRPLFFIELNETYCQRYGHAADDVFTFFSDHNYRAYVHTAETNWRHVDPSNYSGEGNVWFVAAEDDETFTGPKS